MSLSKLACNTLTALVIGAVSLAVLSGLIYSFAGYSFYFPGSALTVFSVAIVPIIMRVNDYHPYRTFGLPNIVTFIRLIMVCLMAGLIVEILHSNTHQVGPVAWLFFGMAVFGIVLDGLDGYLARRLNLQSSFGARFDMEVDALQILCLSGLAMLLDKAGGWVLISGLLRYAFLMATWISPAFSRPLPPSRRRKWVTVVQTSILSALLIPWVTPPWSSISAAIALGLLVYSFSADIFWLLRKASPFRQTA